MDRNAPNLRTETRFARANWGELGRDKFKELRSILVKHQLSAALGDVIFIGHHWYITHSGLLRMARRNKCSGIRTNLERQLSDPQNKRWIFKAVVYNRRNSRGFVGYGDADPSNVSSLVHGAEMRVAETRAVNRALRKAYGIGLCSVEELGWSPREPEPVVAKRQELTPSASNGHSNGQPRLRDRLCLLIRQHQLDANLVKAYAADYCGTATLRDAGRDLVENFINDLAERATKDRAALVCHLNTYSKSQKVTP
jgi:hypothetical protein